MASCTTCATPRPHVPDARRPEQACRPATGGRATAGSNRIVELFSARRFDFGGLQASGTAELVVAEHVDVSADTEARLYLRNHHVGASIGPGASIEVVLYADAPTPEDPALVFRAPAELASLFVTTEWLRTVALAEGLGQAVTVAVRGTQGNPAVACQAVLSAELVLKRRPDHGGGKRIAALPRTELDYTALAPSTSEEVVVVEALDVRDYRTGFVALRVHERSIDPNAFLDVYVHSAFPDNEDPEVAFVDGDEEALLRMDAGTTPDLLSVRLEPGFGPYLLVRVVATQSASGGDLAATLSLDFMGQE